MEALLTGAGALAVSFTPISGRPVLESAFGLSDQAEVGSVRITGLFDAAADPESIRLDLEQSVGGILSDWRVERLEDRNWVRAWLDHFKPIRFGPRLWVCPTGFDPPDDPNAVVIQLDPGSAFGTGTHPTTALCLEWLEAADLRGKRVIDYGCGSGILAVAAAGLGAAEVLAVDVDQAAVEATRENVLRNGVEDRVRIGLADDPAIFDSSSNADIVLANILSGTLIDLAPRFAEWIHLGGSIVLSGILAAQAEGVGHAYDRWFDLRSPVIREGWVLLEGKQRLKMIDKPAQVE